MDIGQVHRTEFGHNIEIQKIYCPFLEEAVSSQIASSTLMGEGTLKASTAHEPLRCHVEIGE